MTLRQLLAGVAAGAAAASAITGRTLVGWLMPVGADRRLFTSASYVAQIVGSIAFLLAAGDNIALLYQTAKSLTRQYPLARSNGCDAARLRAQVVPGSTCGVDDVVVRCEDAIGEIRLA